MSIVDSERPETIASAIRIGAPVSWKKALRAIYDSKGLAETVTDAEILEAQKMLARFEGLFIEPASAASIAGLRKLVARGEIRRDETTVCIATGNGLKDPDVIINNYKLSPEMDVKGGDPGSILGLPLSAVSMR
jgi:threonine synthase